MFKTYIINLERSPDRLERTKNELQKANLTIVERFNAIDGLKQSNHHRVTAVCKQICTKEMIGCALSHIELAKHFLDTMNGGDEYCVVVEDDVRILNHATFIDDIQQLYKAHKDKDVIRLFCQGLCYKKARLAGSTAAYILTRQGANIIKDMKVAYHIDVQFNYLNIHNEQLVSTYDDTIRYKNPIYNIQIMNQSVGFWGTQTIIKIPYTSIKIDFKKLILLISLIIWFIVLYSIYKKGYHVYRRK